MGVVAVLIFQIAVNVGMVIGLMPVTGSPSAYELRRIFGFVYVFGSGHRNECPDEPIRKLESPA